MSRTNTPAEFSRSLVDYPPMGLRHVQALSDRSYVDDHGQPANWSAPDCTWAIFRRNDNGAFAGFLPCGKWSCPACSSSKKNRLERASKTAFDGEKCNFVTLTLGTGRDDSLITKDFARLRASLYKLHVVSPKKKRVYDSMSGGSEKRAYLQLHGVRFFDKNAGHKYFWVKEFTPPSHEYSKWDYRAKCRVSVMSVGFVRHLHLITNFRIPKRLLSHLWRHATGGTSWNCHQTDSHGDLRISYMVKYINKSCTVDADYVNDPAFRNFNKFERRYGVSCLPDSRKSIFKLTRESKGTCWVQRLAHDGDFMNAQYDIWNSPYSQMLYRRKLAAIAAHPPVDVLVPGFCDSGAFLTSCSRPIHNSPLLWGIDPPAEVYGTVPDDSGYLARRAPPPDPFSRAVSNRCKREYLVMYPDHAVSWVGSPSLPKSCRAEPACVPFENSG